LAKRACWFIRRTELGNHVYIYQEARPREYIGRKCIIELKTINPNAYTYLPKMHNMFQLMTYEAITDSGDDVLWHHLITRKKDGLLHEFHIKLKDSQHTYNRSFPYLQ